MNDRETDIARLEAKARIERLYAKWLAQRRGKRARGKPGAPPAQTPPVLPAAPIGNY